MAAYSWRACCAICVWLVAGIMGPAVVRGQAPGPAVVEVAEVVAEDVASGQTYVGTVMPLRKVVVGAAVDGRVVEFPINEGDRVAEGAALAQLLTDTISLEVAAAEAELELRRQELSELENGSRPEEIEQARAKMEGARAQWEYLDSRARRTQRLFDQGQAVSQEELQEAVSAAVAARQAYEDFKAAHALAVAGPRAERIAQARAQVAMQEATVERLKDMRQKHTVIARFDGFVTAEFTEVGAWLSRGAPVAELVALDQVDVLAHVIEDHVPFVQLGMIARVEIPSLPGRVFQGTVVSVVPQADAQSRTFPVKVRIENVVEDSQPLIKAGMLARVVLPTGKQQLAQLVPKDALVLGGPQPVLWVVKANTIKAVDNANSGKRRYQGEVEPVPVELGVTRGDKIQVQAALRPGDFVVVRGNERLLPPRPGQPTVVQWTAAESSEGVVGTSSHATN